MQQYVDYGFVRTQNMIEDGERRARRHVNVGPAPSTRKGWLGKAAHWLSARWTQPHRPHSIALPAHGERPAG
jgi:hypothetical protein